MIGLHGVEYDGAARARRGWPADRIYPLAADWLPVHPHHPAPFVMAGDTGLKGQTG
jgi:hypothetical protein